MSSGGNGSHWEGCETAHHDCALVKLRKIESDAKQMRNALKRIAVCYMTPEQLREECERIYGLSYVETLESAYENIMSEATGAIDVVHPYYLARCPKCHWLGSSELCVGAIDEDCNCPRCFTDCEEDLCNELEGYLHEDKEA